jgi:hypothetical protein
VVFVFLLVWLIHAESSVITSGDSRWFLPTAVSIIEHGNINLDEYAERIEEDEFYGIEAVDGHYYNQFPIGTALLSLPPVWFVSEFLDEGLGLSLEDLLQQDRMAELERLIASLFAALASVFIFRLARRRMGGLWRPLMVTFVFAFASPVWSTASRALWQHGPSILLLSAVLYLLSDLEQERVFPMALAGPLLAMAYVVRPTNALSYAFLMLAVVWYSRRGFVAAVGLSLVIFVPFMVFNLQLYGEILPPYFASTRLRIGPTFLEALAGNLISPGRGIFLFTPVLVFSLFGMVTALKTGRNTVLHVALIGIIVVHWICVSMFGHWWGGYSNGPRFFSDMTPYLVYFLAIFLEQLRRMPVRKSVIWWFPFLVSLGISSYAHFRSANSWRVVAWNETPISVDECPERVWDWQDIPFLRRGENTPIE